MAYSSPGMSGWRTTIEGKGSEEVVATGLVGHIRRIGMSGMDSDDIDVTTMSSENPFREFVTGLTDAGELEMDIVYEADTFDQLFGAIGRDHAVGASDLEQWEITFPDDSVFSCRGYLRNLGVESPMDEAIEGTAALKISGKPEFSVGSSGV